MPKKPFLLRIDEQVLGALQRWADEDLRSLNGQIDYLLRQALRARGVKLRGTAQASSFAPDDEAAAPEGQPPPVSGSEPGLSPDGQQQ